MFKDIFIEKIVYFYYMIIWNYVWGLIYISFYIVFINESDKFGLLLKY